MKETGVIALRKAEKPPTAVRLVFYIYIFLNAFLKFYNITLFYVCLATASIIIYEDMSAVRWEEAKRNDVSQLSVNAPCLQNY